MTNTPNRAGVPTVRLILILGTLSAFGPLTTDLYLPALPTIAQEFASPHVHQSMAIYFFGLALGQLFYGPLSDRVGRRPPLLFGCGLYTLATLGCALAPNMESLIALRLLQALGASVGMVTTLSVVRDLFDVRDSARVLSYLMLVMGVAPVLAPLLGGQILLYGDWRMVFGLLVVYGLVCIGLVAFALPESLPPSRRTKTPLSAVLPDYLRLLTDLRFQRFALPQSLMGAGFFAYLSGASLVFIGVYGVSAQNFGFVFGLNAFGLIAAAQLNTWLLGRYTGTQILTRSMAVMAVASVLLVVAASSGLGGMWAVWGLLFVCIAGSGLVRPNALAAVLAPYPERAGLASSLLGALGTGVGALAGAVLGLFPFKSALPLAIVIAAAYVLAVVIFWGIRWLYPAEGERE